MPISLAPPMRWGAEFSAFLSSGETLPMRWTAEFSAFLRRIGE